MESPPNTVIVAEDEALVRMLAAETLADAGFSVVQVANAEEAIAALQIHAGNVALLFTDIHMSGELTGVELANLVTERWPRVAILVTSGRGKPRIGELPPGSQFIAKPYLAERIVAEVHALISG
jgi:two-component system, response regulator PdtaR